MLFLSSADFFEKIADLLPFIVGAVLLLIVILLVAAPPKAMTTREITVAATAISASFVLSCAKFSPVANGGSVTAAAIIPIMLYCYASGLRRGFFAGFIYALLQMLQSPGYIIGVYPVIFDFLLPFTIIGIMPLLKPLSHKLKGFDLLIMLTIYYVIRYASHVISGVLAWETPFVGSLIYNAQYIPLDFAIAAIVTTLLIVKNVVDRLCTLIAPKKVSADPQ